MANQDESELFDHTGKGVTEGNKIILPDLDLPRTRKGTRAKKRAERRKKKNQEKNRANKN